MRGGCASGSGGVLHGGCNNNKNVMCDGFAVSHKREKCKVRCGLPKGEIGNWSILY